MWCGGCGDTSPRLCHRHGGVFGNGLDWNADMSKTQPTEILTKPSLAALALVLRNRELWPEDFTWDYTRCSNCAIGLAAKLWLNPSAQTFVFPFMSMDFALNGE